MPKENCILKPTEQDRFAAAFELLTHFAKIAQHFCWILSDASVNFFFLFSFFFHFYLWFRGWSCYHASSFCWAFKRTNL